MSRQNISITVDAVVFKKNGEEVGVLLVQRKNDPYKNLWALPGGFVEDRETLETAMERELKEEAGIKFIFFEQLQAFSKPDRDPRGRTITIAFAGYVGLDSNPKAADDAKDAKWFDLNQLPELAFDHKIIIDYAVSHFLPSLL